MFMTNWIAVIYYLYCGIVKSVIVRLLIGRPQVKVIQINLSEYFTNTSKGWLISQCN